MKMFKKKDGFTLVELIVVIAILAILAGVAIPAYSGYLEKANESADITQLSAIKTAVTATYATEGEVAKIVVGVATPDTISVTLANGTTKNPLDGTTDFLTYLGETTFDVDLKSKEYKDGAQWDNTTAAGDNQGKWVKKS